MLCLPLPKTAISTSAVSRLGKAVRLSLTRMSTSSTQPPYQPVSPPTMTPASRPMPTEPRAIRKVEPAPCTTREKMSRPKLSVPKGWRRQGESIFSAAFMALGS